MHRRDRLVGRDEEQATKALSEQSVGKVEQLRETFRSGSLLQQAFGVLEQKGPNRRGLPGSGRAKRTGVSVQL